MPKHNHRWGDKSRHARGYGSEWVKLRSLALTRDQHLCQECIKSGRPTPATDVDHIKPKSKGGTDDLDNLQSLCAPCHAEKTARENQERVSQPPIGEDGWPQAGGAG